MFHTKKVLAGGIAGIALLGATALQARATTTGTATQTVDATLASSLGVSFDGTYTNGSAVTVSGGTSTVGTAAAPWSMVANDTAGTTNKQAFELDVAASAGTGGYTLKVSGDKPCTVTAADDCLTDYSGSSYGTTQLANPLGVSCVAATVGSITGGTAPALCTALAPTPVLAAGTVLGSNIASSLTGGLVFAGGTDKWPVTLDQPTT